MDRRVVPWLYNDVCSFASHRDLFDMEFERDNLNMKLILYAYDAIRDFEKNKYPFILMSMNVAPGLDYDGNDCEFEELLDSARSPVSYDYSKFGLEVISRVRSSDSLNLKTPLYVVSYSYPYYELKKKALDVGADKFYNMINVKGFNSILDVYRDIRRRGF